MRRVGNHRFCCDEGLAAVAFGAHDGGRAGAVSRWLRRAGLIGSRFGYWKDIAVIYQKTASPTIPCDWLFIGNNSDGVVFASLAFDDHDPFEIMVPTAWAFEDSLTKKITPVSLSQHDEKFELVGSDESADIYRDRETGKKIRAALTRPRETAPPPETSGPIVAGNPVGGVHSPQYRQMPDNTPKPKKQKPVFDENGNEIVTVKMGFSDYHEMVENSDEGEYLEDDVHAVKVGSNRYRLAENPMWTEMATFNDVVEGKVDECGVFYVERVVEESGLKTIRTGVPHMFYFSDFGKAFLDSVMEAGGMWDII